MMCDLIIENMFILYLQVIYSLQTVVIFLIDSPLDLS